MDKILWKKIKEKEGRCTIEGGQKDYFGEVRLSFSRERSVHVLGGFEAAVWGDQFVVWKGIEGVAVWEESKF